MKFCKDCRWYEASPNSKPDANFDKCTANPPYSPVTGERSKYSVGRYCSVMRDAAALCGPAGEWFEPAQQVRIA
jgi:hypothetical protein